VEVKPPGKRPGLPGNVISFYIVPLDPAHSAGLVEHVPVKEQQVKCSPGIFECNRIGVYSWHWTKLFLT